MLNKVAYALAAGCTVVMKPSPETPLETYIIAEAAEAAGLPAGVVNLVCGHREASDHLVRNPGVDKVSFTGSTAAGKRIASVCAERIARCTLELGGKSAAIVRDDFPTAEAATLLTQTITLMSGQVCAMLSRAIGPRRRHDELAEAIAAEMRRVVIGHSDDARTQLGPLAMKRQLDRVERYIDDGRRTSDLVTGGRRPPQMKRGYFIEPTLFANVNNGSRIAQEEIFGPVLSLIPVEDDDDAIRVANESIYGLNGSVLTHDANAAYRMARRIRTGVFGQRAAPRFGPHGGFKQSGLGLKAAWGPASPSRTKPSSSTKHRRAVRTRSTAGETCTAQDEAADATCGARYARCAPCGTEVRSLQKQRDARGRRRARGTIESAHTGCALQTPQGSRLFRHGARARRGVRVQPAAQGRRRRPHRGGGNDRRSPVGLRHQVREPAVLGQADPECRREASCPARRDDPARERLFRHAAAERRHDPHALSS
jgi:delta 1-pyrroline-5-carboxylate dehydrogenase